MTDVDVKAEFVRVLEHQRVQGLAVQQSWFRGQLTAEANVLFLQLAPGSWLRFFFDAGVFFWRMVDAPDAGERGDEDSEYRIVEAAPEGAMGTVSAVHFTAPDRDTVVLTISFAGGAQLVLQNRDDRNTLLVSLTG